MENVRNPAVAGQFYPGSEKLLRKEVESLIDVRLEKVDSLGAVSPHAGYVYSGPVAGSVFSSIEPKPNYIIMGPNHTGTGKPFSVSVKDSWRTPLGEVKVCRDLARAILKNSAYFKEDESAHAYEHSIEVELPFLQVLQKSFKFVPITISYAKLGVYRELGKELADSIRGMKLEKAITIIASSDMTHYEPHEVAKRKDSKAIDAILELDEYKLIDNIEKLDISMCGYAPTAIMIVTAKELGAKKARLVKYQTSGDTSGDYSSVVGYAGVIVA